MGESGAVSFSGRSAGVGPFGLSRGGALLRTGALGAGAPSRDVGDPHARRRFSPRSAKLAVSAGRDRGGLSAPPKRRATGYRARRSTSARACFGRDQPPLP